MQLNKKAKQTEVISTTNRILARFKPRESSPTVIKAAISRFGLYKAKSIMVAQLRNIITEQNEKVSATNKIVARFKLIACCIPGNAFLVWKYHESTG